MAPVSDNATFDVAGVLAGLPVPLPELGEPVVELDPHAAAASITGTAIDRATTGARKRDWLDFTDLHHSVPPFAVDIPTCTPSSPRSPNSPET